MTVHLSVAGKRWIVVKYLSLHMSEVAHHISGYIQFL